MAPVHCPSECQLQDQLLPSQSAPTPSIDVQLLAHGKVSNAAGGDDCVYFQFGQGYSTTHAIANRYNENEVR